MQNSLNHRGPDDRGSFVSAKTQFALAHTRLSILDLSPAGRQPMSSADGRYWIGFNGEIYNYLELRQEIEVRGQTSDVSEQPQIRGGKSEIAASGSEQPAGGGQLCWRSNSDTEVLLNAFRIWGTDSFEKVRGMFAAAIWDDAKEKLFLARDPFGIKPLYYYTSDDMIVFASEIRALLASGLIPRTLSREGLMSYVRYGSVEDPLTIIDGIKTLAPGQILTAERKQGHIRVQTSLYASSVTSNSLPPFSDRKDAVHMLRELLKESVRMQLRSDVPIATFLSGGIDSSALVALMSTVADRIPKTFSVVFPERDFSEAAHARQVAELFGAEHHEIVLSEHGLLRLLPDALESMDRPTMDGINTYVISKAVRESGINVALSGLGGDELFGGYPSFRRVEQAQRLAVLPDTFRRTAAQWGHRWMNGSTRRSKLWDLVGSDLSPCSIYRISRRLFAPDEIRALIPGGCALEEAPACASQDDPINVIAAHELTGYMTHTLLRDTDQMSMAHSLEIRVPFIDPLVVAHVLRLPGKWKVEKNRPKALLLDAIGNLLPDEIWHRPKMGFTLPFSRWMTSALAPEMDDVFSDPQSFKNVGIESNYARHVWNAFRSKPQEEPWSRSWALYVLKRWCDENGVIADSR
jgi:asparagine synthase (glutamine-hydrolysing)